jgi:hypothetical protein
LAPEPVEVGETNEWSMNVPPVPESGAALCRPVKETFIDPMPQREIR